jgi:phosphatidylinositol glycan class S
VPLGQLKSSFNYDTTDKRVLNFENVVNDDDNVKQDMSIDVYGRKQQDGEDEEGGEAAAAEEEEDDDLDSLLSG